MGVTSLPAPRRGPAPEGGAGRWPGVWPAIVTMLVLAGYDALAGPELVLVGLLSVGPCLAAVTGSTRAVAGAGAFAVVCLLLLSWPDRLWGTRSQVLHLAAVVAVTLVSAWVAGRRADQERAAGRARARFAAAFESAGVGLVLVGGVAGRNSVAHPADVNPAARDIFGWRTGPAPAVVLEVLAAADGQVRQCEIDTDGTRRHLAVVRTALPAAGDGDGLDLVQITDLTAQRAAEQQLADAARVQEQSRRLVALGRLAGGVAHDFNTLLAVILSHADLVDTQLATETARADLAQVRSAAVRAAGLTRQLLTFARQEPTDPQPQDVNALVSGLGTLLAHTSGQRVTCVLDLAPGALTTLVDRAQFEQTVINLALNARDAMADGGTLTIRTRRMPAQPPAGPRIRIEVEDTGTGMTADVRARAFEPFFTTKDVGRGTGLGLAGAFGVMEQHGGTVHLDSTLGVGTTVTLELPESSAAVVPEPSGAGSTGGPGSAGNTAGPTRILLVEDEAALRTATARILEHAGHTVFTAADGAAGLARFRADPAAVDLVVTDVAMPVMRGDEMARRIADTHPDVPIVLLSGYGPATTPDSIPAARRLAKPVHIDDLLAAVRDALAAGRPPEPGAPDPAARPAR